jgi:hypothetical protein
MRNYLRRRVYTASDDGARLWIEGQLIINQWVDQGVTEHSGQVYLPAGWHDITVDYYENGYGAAVSASYAGPGVGKQIIPSSALRVPQPAQSGIIGRYYNSDPGTPDPLINLVGTRNDSTVNFNFDTGPGIGGLTSNEFAVRWLGRVFIPTTGDWQFITRTDDGARFFIDTNNDKNMEMRIDQWGPQGTTDHGTGAIFLGAGFYNICFEYFEDGGGEDAYLFWEGPGVGRQIIPAGNLGSQGYGLFNHDRGLIAELYNNQSVSGWPTVVRIDNWIYRDWGEGSPQDRIGVDTFSVKWRGKIEPPATGQYYFFPTTDDGVDLWVNGQKLISDFPNPHGPTELTGGPITLQGGTKYFIEMRMQEGGGGAYAALRWQGPTISKRILDDDYLYPILNEALTDIGLTPNPGSLRDTDGANTTAGVLSTTDPDNSTGGSQTHSYTLASGTGSTHNYLFNISGASLRNNNTLGAGTYNVRVRSTDNGQLPDNLYTEKQFNIVVRDNTPPVITLIGGTVVAECGGSYTDPGYSAADNVDGNITGNVVVGGQTVDTMNPGDYTVRYNVSDAAGNNADEKTRLVQVRDTTRPQILLVGNAVIDVECGDSWSDPGATVTDTCDDDASLTAALNIDGLPIDTGDTGTHQITYNVTDSSGNAADQVTRTVNVNDTTPPVINLIGSAAMTVECGGTYTEAGASATDVCDGTVSVTIGGDTVDPANPGDYAVTYDAQDGAGNNATRVTRVVTVQDTQPPVITLNGSASVSVVKGFSFTDPGAAAEDVCEGSVSVAVGGDTVDTDTEGVYVITYDAQDSEGHSAIQKTRTVTVAAGEPPVITLLGNAAETVDCGETYTDAGATAEDPEDGIITADIVTVNPVDTGTPDVYTVTYNVTDSSGNPASEVTRTVEVTDTAPPVLSLVGSASVDVECGSAYADAGATATDACEGDLDAEIVQSGDTVNPAVRGTYEIHFDVADSSGNAAPQVTRTVNVVDTTDPVITLLGQATVNISCGETYVDAGAEATDTCADDAVLTNAITATGLPLDTGVSGTHLIVYEVTDNAGNSATPVTRTVTVADNEAPVITLNGQDTVSLEVEDTFTDPGAYAIDACEGTVPVTAGGDAVDTSQVGTYIITYDAQDTAGNSAETVTRTVFVGAGLPPAVINNPEDVDAAFGDTVLFVVDAAGLGTLSYQWKRDGTPLTESVPWSGVNTPALTITGVTNAEEGTYSVEVTSQASSVESGTAALNVIDPAITGQPQSRTVAPGTDVDFSITAAGSGTLVYTWYKDEEVLVNGGNISGADTAALTIGNAQEDVDEGYYHVVVSGGADGDIISDTARLQVGNPAITKQPDSVQTDPGASVTFEVEAIGNAKLSYRWRFNGVSMSDGSGVSGAQTPQLTLSNVDEADQGAYSCIVVGQNIVYSNDAILTINGPPEISSIVVIPYEGVVDVNDNAVISVVVGGGVSPFTYRWYRNGTALTDGGGISGSGTDTLEIDPATEDDDGVYYCRVTNSAGTAESDELILTVGLSLSVQLYSQIAEIGQRFRWTASVSGEEGGVSWQWMRELPSKAFVPLTNTGNVSGANTNTLVIDPVTADDSGYYMAEAADDYETVNSIPARLTVVENLAAGGIAGLSALAALTALAGARSLRRRKR